MLAAPAWAYFTSQGSGSGSAQLALLLAPSDVTATATPPGDDVVVSWGETPPASPGAGVGYLVTRSDGTGWTPVCGSPPGSPVDVGEVGAHLSCSDQKLPAGTYSYAVTAELGSWTSQAVTTAPVQVPQVLTSLRVDPSTSSPTAGTALSLRITALDQSALPYLAWSGMRCLVFSGPGPSLTGTAETTPTYPPAGACPQGSAVQFDQGVAKATATLVKAETAAIRARDVASGLVGTSPPITVQAAPDPPPTTTAISTTTTTTAAAPDPPTTTSTTTAPDPPTPAPPAREPPPTSTTAAPPSQVQPAQGAG